MSADFTAVLLSATGCVRDACLCLHSQRAARALARRSDAILRPVGLTNTQFSLLNGLNGPEPKRAQTLAALLGSDRTTVVAAVKTLVRRGLVAVLPDPADRRARRLTLTLEGRQRLAQALPV